MRKREIFELRTKRKKRSSEIFAWKMRNLSGKSGIFFGSFFGPDSRPQISKRTGAA